MSEDTPLTFAVLERRPRLAARVLEDVEPRDAAALLDRAPARLAAPVLGAMASFSAARCLERMDAEKAVGLLRALDHSDAVSILRQVAPDVRETILELSTRRFARNFRTSLVYPVDTVGAWMDVGHPSLAETATVKEVRSAVMRLPQSASHVFLVDDKKHYAGAVPVFEILRRSDTVQLGEIADRSVKPLSNRESLAACGENPGWDSLTTLPVIGRRQTYVGALSRSSLRRAQAGQSDAARLDAPGSILLHLLSAFAAVVAAINNLTLLSDSQAQATRQGGRHGRKRKNRNQ